MPAAVSISLALYLKYREECWGVCTVCRDWTADCVEPDARKYECPDCGERSVYGAEEAMMLGLVEAVTG